MDSGLNSMVLASNNEMVLLPVNEPTFGTRRKSQIQVGWCHALLHCLPEGFLSTPGFVPGCRHPEDGMHHPISLDVMLCNPALRMVPTLLGSRTPLGRLVKGWAPPLPVLVSFCIRKAVAWHCTTSDLASDIQGRLLSST